MAADVAQCERSNIKCYASAFSNILIRIDRDSYFLHSSTLDLLDANDLASHVAILEIPGNFFLVIGHKNYLFYIPRTLQGTQRCVLRRERMMFSSHQ